jgi:MFS superfamily sulfate permease-like transporter
MGARICGGDLVAGLTVWTVLVPEALAYATIAGVSPVVGPYAAPPPLVLYAAFGRSRHLVVGPMAATAALSAAILAWHLPNARSPIFADAARGFLYPVPTKFADIVATSSRGTMSLLTSSCGVSGTRLGWNRGRRATWGKPRKPDLGGNPSYLSAQAEGGDG